MLCTLTKHSSRDRNEKSSLIDAGLETFEANLNLHWKFVETIKIFISIVFIIQKAWMH